MVKDTSDSISKRRAKRREEVFARLRESSDRAKNMHHLRAHKKLSGDEVTCQVTNRRHAVAFNDRLLRMRKKTEAEERILRDPLSSPKASRKVDLNAIAKVVSENKDYKPHHIIHSEDCPVESVLYKAAGVAKESNVRRK